MAQLSLVCLHGLGLSARLFDRVAEHLGSSVDTFALDLPGFGGAPAATGTTVQDMVDAVILRIAARQTGRWLLVGHSMGGKIASIVARRALDGEPGLFGLAGVVLLAGSPPSPEPMSDEQRTKMIGWAADGPLDAAAAREFITSNVSSALPDDLAESATADLRRTSREAWLSWLERGSREDRSEFVGTLDLPALIVAGGDDGPLGEQGQRRLNLPVYPRGRLVVLPEAAHLLPLERPAEVAEAIMGFWRDDAGRGPAVPTDWAATMASERVSVRTRGILAARAVADDPAYAPTVLDATQLATLRVLADLVVPQDDDSNGIDLAARVEAQLAAGEGDGWRQADLPVDAEAYRAGLDALHGLGELPLDEQHARLEALSNGTFDATQGGLSRLQLRAWFDDVRTDLASHWLAHPATMADIGFDGYFTGGDGPRLRGWQLLSAGEREAWEPPVEVDAVKTDGR